jgi:NAD(P)-dependent dehydrogenase (short-subunit alcohol dehydrogenase family)
MSVPRIVLITGAGGGIGGAIIKEFIGNPLYKVIALYSGKNNIERYSDVTYFPCNFEDNLFELELVDLLSCFDKVDILINNAGSNTDANDFLNLDFSDIENSIKINFKGAFLLTKFLLPLMIKNDFGRIINIGSNTVSLKGSRTSFSYFLSKSMLDSLTSYISKHFSQFNISCNCIRPGLINSGMHLKVPGYSENKFLLREKLVPGGKSGHVEDISRMVKFLSLDSSGFITGQIISIAKGE